MAAASRAFSNSLGSHSSVHTELLERNYALTSLFELSSDAILVVDAQTDQILQANPRAETLYGFSSGELLRMRFNELRAAPIAGTPVDERQDELAGRAILRRLEWHLTKAGEVRYVECRIREGFSGETRMGVIVHDLTDIVQQRDELVFLEQFNNLIFDSLPFAITIKTREGAVSYQNLVAASIFGHLIGATPNDSQPGPERDLLLPLYEAAKAQEKRHIELAWRGRHYNILVAPIKDERANIDLVLELAQDISESKAVQQELVRAQRMEAVGNLAGGIAHDFNNLLSGIMGYANLIQAVVEENEQVVQYSHVIEQTCVRASELTQQLLQFARRKAVVRERFDLNAIARYAGKLLRHSLKKEIRLGQKLCSHPLIVQGDPTQVQQMILNLCFSANDSLSEGQIMLTTRREVVEDPEAAPVKGMMAGSYAVVAMQDSGPVLDRESRISILDPLFLGRASADNRPMDLRLSVADAIAHSHGGHILFDGPKPDELIVTIYLPEHLPKEERLDDDEPDAPLRGQETLLVIDDEEVIRNLMLTSLARFGYRVLVAANGEDGLQLYSTFRSEIRLVMLDLGLPGIDGAKVFAAIRELDAQAPVILFTGNEADPRIKSLLEAGALGAVSKPISLKRLTQIIRSTLDGSPTPLVFP